jgi:mono/diheme cytochrome c family protein
MAGFMKRTAGLIASGLMLSVAGCGALDPARTRPSPSPPGALRQESVDRGRAFAETACSGCHAIDRTGTSPLAEAPPLRDVVARRSPDSLVRGFSEGLVTSHPTMPAYVFRASEIDDLMAWLDTLNRAEPPPR